MLFFPPGGEKTNSMKNKNKAKTVKEGKKEL